MSDDHDDDWTGSGFKPWLNPPMQHDLGSSRGSWRFALAGFAMAFATAIVLLVLVRTGNLSDRWTYVGLPVAGVSAVSLLLLTILKARSVDRSI